MELTSLVRLPRTVKALQRMREILSVVVKYGWGDAVARLHLENSFQISRSLLRSRRLRSEVEHFSSEERVRMALEELGPTFIKLGQILATRPDLVPLSLIEELRKLQDRVPPFDAGEARAQVERELGQPVDLLFAHFETQPLAAASIAQVHRARLPSGEDVVVKVRRPGLGEIIRTDLDILVTLAELVEENLPETRTFAPRAIVDEFARAITREVDLSHEATNLARFGRHFADDPRIHVPRVFPDHSTERVLTLEYVEGIKADQVEKIAAAGIDRKEVARIGVEFIVEQIFGHGFFHADPHPGNVFVMPGPVLAPIDMGMMGRLDQETIDRLLDLMVGVLLRDADRVVRLFEKADLVDDDVDRSALRRDADELIERYSDMALGDVDVAAYLTDLFEVLTRHHVRVPAELFLVGKALSTMEGMARELDPELDPLATLRPFVLKRYLERLRDPRFLARDWIAAGREGLDLVQGLPGDLRRITRDLRRGELSLRVRSDELEHLVREQSRSTNRLALAGVLSAMLLGSSVLLAFPSETAVGPLPLTSLLGLLGLGLAGSVSLVLVFGFLRSGRF